MIIEQSFLCFLSNWDPIDFGFSFKSLNPTTKNMKKIPFIFIWGWMEDGGLPYTQWSFIATIVAVHSVGNIFN